MLLNITTKRLALEIAKTRSTLIKKSLTYYKLAEATVKLENTDS